jgi:hypothetical protein
MHHPGKRGWEGFDVRPGLPPAAVR